MLRREYINLVNRTEEGRTELSELSRGTNEKSVWARSSWLVPTGALDLYIWYFSFQIPGDKVIITVRRAGIKSKHKPSTISNTTTAHEWCVTANDGRIDRRTTRNRADQSPSIASSFTRRRLCACVRARTDRKSNCYGETEIDSSTHQLLTWRMVRPVSWASCFFWSSDGYGCYKKKKKIKI